MTPRPNQVRPGHVWPLVVGMMSLAGCGDNLSGPNECIFAYTLDPASVVVQIGDSTVVRAIPAADCGAPSSVTWRVEHPAMATVRSTGSLTAVVHGVAAGNTVLNAENGDKSGFAIIEVK